MRSLSIFIAQSTNVQFSMNTIRSIFIGPSRNGAFYDGTAASNKVNTTWAKITGTPAREEDFTFDPTSNRSQYVTKVSGWTTLNQRRTHNKVNEITAINRSRAYIVEDAAGNSVEPLIKQLRDNDASCRAGAAVALGGQMGVREALPALKTALGDGDVRVHDAAADAIEYIENLPAWWPTDAD